tara:strand:+ start:783 stop:1727 length:945 start_codon:yes stop_codon:yes gene_type:complete
MAQGSPVKREWTTQDLTDVFDNYLHRIDDIYNKFEGLMGADPGFAAMANQLYQGDKEVYKRTMIEKGDYCMTINTEEEWEKQQERCENFVSMGGELDIAVVVVLDPQINTNRVIIQGSYPTFYTTWKNPLFENGNPGFLIAYPPRITEMTDKEVKVALAHEFGHIKQKHMFVRLPGQNPTDVNIAMDYSINWGFNHEDITLYEELARKMFKGQTGATKVPFPEKKGGLDVKVSIDHYWKAILDLMNKLKEEDGEGGEGPPPPQEPIEIGDIVKERKKGGGYGRVTDVDPQTGKITAEPMTKDEFEQAKQEAKGQ